MTEPLTPAELEAIEAEGLGLSVPGGPILEHRSTATVGGVDFAERTITVIAVPYEEPASVNFQGGVWNEVFSRSAFNGIETRQRSVKAMSLLEMPNPNSHTGAKVVGRATAFYPERPEGLVADLRISRTATGDETLELANDGALDVSVGFMVKGRLDEVLNRATRTRRINRAFLDHIAFVSSPAYAGAKVLTVRADNSPDPEPNGSRTPRLDAFLEDDILQWAEKRING